MPTRSFRSGSFVEVDGRCGLAEADELRWNCGFFRFPRHISRRCGLSLSGSEPKGFFFDFDAEIAIMGVTAAVHPSDPVLQAYGLGKLDDVSAESVDKHMESCRACRQRVAELSSDEFLGRLQNAKVGSDKPAAGWSPFGASSTEGVRRPVIPPPPVDALPPEPVHHPDYEIVRELGRGGMGVVYLVYNKLMARKEVLKVGGGDIGNRPEVLERFQREIRSAAMLHHTNIVTAYSALRFGESLALAMEYVQGCDLSQLVKSSTARGQSHMLVTSSTRPHLASNMPSSVAWFIATSSRAT